MIFNILAKSVSSFSIGGLLIILVFVPILILLTIGLIRLVRYLGSAGKEQKLMRIEMGKLAEEVHLLRREIKGDKNDNNST